MSGFTRQMLATARAVRQTLGVWCHTAVDSRELFVDEPVHLVFVYGTLLRGESNHDVWLAAARFIGTDRTAPYFTLFSFGDYPALVHGGEQSVPGEVFEVSAAQLARLDDLEECPGFYERQQLRLASGCEAWVYTLHGGFVQGARVIVSGSWRSRCS